MKAASDRLLSSRTSAHLLNAGQPAPHAVEVGRLQRLDKLVTRGLPRLRAISLPQSLGKPPGGGVTLQTQRLRSYPQVRVDPARERCPVELVWSNVIAPQVCAGDRAQSSGVVTNRRALQKPGLLRLPRRVQCDKRGGRDDAATKT
jgi:hypothetical protein